LERRPAATALRAAAVVRAVRAVRAAAPSQAAAQTTSFSRFTQATMMMDVLTVVAQVAQVAQVVAARAVRETSLHHRAENSAVRVKSGATAPLDENLEPASGLAKMQRGVASKKTIF
jgi:hypothetical protein